MAPTMKFKRNIDDEDEVEILSADDVSPAVWSIKMLPNPLNTDEKHTAANFLRAHVEEGWIERWFSRTTITQARLLTGSERILTHPWVRVRCTSIMSRATARFRSRIHATNALTRKPKECIDAYNH
jgi:hypothetical protein